MSTDYKDQTITCKDCRTEFVFSARDQAFYESRQFSPPARCKTCRDRRKAEREAQGQGRG